MTDDCGIWNSQQKPVIMNHDICMEADLRRGGAVAKERQIVILPVVCASELAGL